MVCLVSSSLGLAVHGAAIAETSPVSGGTISVTGRGEISRAPDLATVDATIQTNNDDMTRGLSENNRRFAALLAKLEPIGIHTGDVISTSLRSSFNPRPARGETAVAGQLYGFIVTRNVRINVNALGQAGAVVDAATAAGASDINGVSYGFRDRPAVERMALAAAVADAFEQAQTIATAAHVQIVRVLRIGNEPFGITPQPAMQFSAAMRSRAEAPVPTTIAPSDLQVANSISITYVIR